VRVARYRFLTTWIFDAPIDEVWERLLGPVARPAFAWNHGWIMRRGGEGLARDLGCSLVAAS
jgi:hypothetical protein